MIALSTLCGRHDCSTRHDRMRDPDGIDRGKSPLAPPRLYERLAQLSGYTWDHSFQPFHSVREGCAFVRYHAELRPCRLTTTGISLVYVTSIQRLLVPPQYMDSPKQIRLRARRNKGHGRSSNTGELAALAGASLTTDRPLRPPGLKQTPSTSQSLHAYQPIRCVLNANTISAKHSYRI